MYALEPEGIANLTASMTEIQIPPRYEPDAGENFTSTGILRKQVHHLSKDALGNIVIREMQKDDVTKSEEAARILADELKDEGWIYEFDSASSNQRTFTIGGKECVFEFQTGNAPVHGVAMRQAFGAVPCGGGITYVLVNDAAEHWDEAVIGAMIESIKVGRPAPASESLSTGTGADRAAEDSAMESTGVPRAVTPDESLPDGSEPPPN